MKHERLARISLIAVMVQAGCDTGGEPAPPPTLVLRDSAGVAIAEHTPSQLTDLPVTRLDSPDVRIGSVNGEPEQQLYQVRGVTRLSDGRIVVLNGGTHSVRFYDARGELVRSVGRRGSGPGEFMLPLGLYRMGADTVAVFDLAERRFSFIGPEGDAARLVRAPQNISGLAGFLDSSRVVLAEPVFPRDPGQIQLRVVVRMEDLESGRADTITVLDGWEEVQSAHGELRMMTRVPYTVQPVVRARDGEVYVLDGGSPDVRIYDGSGRLQRISRLDAPPRPVGRAEFDRYVELQLAEDAERGDSREPGRPPAAELRRIYSGMQLPAEQPFFDRLVVARNGDVWLRDFELLPADFHRWTVLDPTGRAIARIRTPAGFTLREAGADYVLGVSRDELDVEYVHLYRLRRH